MSNYSEKFSNNVEIFLDFQCGYRQVSVHSID